MLLGGWPSQEAALPIITRAHQLDTLPSGPHLSQLLQGRIKVPRTVSLLGTMQFEGNQRLLMGAG
jgi:hypothetical protein